MGKVYILEAAGLYKIGITSGSISARILGLQTGNGSLITEVMHGEITDNTKMEQELHYKYAHRRAVGEWFALTEAELHTAIDIIRGGDEFVPTTRLDAVKLIGLGAHIDNPTGGCADINIKFNADQTTQAVDKYLAMEKQAHIDGKL